MALREFTVRITREGKIIFDLTGLDQEQIRLHREMAEEVLGRILMEAPSTEPPSSGGALAEVEDRNRLRDRH